VFSSPVLYQVQTESKRDLGSLEQAFVDRLVEEMSTFLLGGRAWQVVSIHHGDRLVRVRSAPRGKMPSWGGFVPQFLGFEVCQAMKVLTSDETYPFPDACPGAPPDGAMISARSSGAAALPAIRRHDGHLVDLRRPDRPDAQICARVKAGWKVVPDNFSSGSGRRRR
jgi:ATP-dependent Lhr-like helicase